MVGMVWLIADSQLGVSDSDSSNHVTLHIHIFVNKKYLEPKILLSEHSHCGRSFSPLDNVFPIRATNKHVFPINKNNIL